jgi:HEAT repeat protein
MSSTQFLPAAAAILLTLAGANAAQDKKDAGVQPDGLKNLRHPDAGVRYRTADLLAKQGPLAKFAIEELRAALKDEDPFVRLKVAEAIWKVERPIPGTILPTVQRALKDKDAEVRATACAVIGMMGAKGKAAVPLLIDTLKDKELSVVMADISALGEVGPAAREAAGPLLAMSGYADFVYLEPLVAAALGDMGSAVVPELQAALKDTSVERRRVATSALGNIGPDAADAIKGLTKALGDAEPAIRALAARALGNIGKGAKSALPRLADATADQEPQVRIRAAMAVWQVGGETRHVAVLVRCLDEPSVAAREAACRALATMGGEAKDAAGALTKALADKEPTVRQAALIAVGNLGPAAKGAAGALLPLLNDADKTLRLHAAFALWQVTGEAKEPLGVLRPLLAEEPRLRGLAVEKIGLIGPAAEAALAELVTMYRQEDGEGLRRVIGEAIKRIDATLAGKLGVR